MQQEINEMTQELEKVKELLDEKLESLGPEELPVNVSAEESRRDKVSSLYVEVGDLEVLDDNDCDQ